MNNIKSKEDVLEWAKTIVEANGDKYISLSKTDMLAIAQFVVDHADAKAMPPRESDEPPAPPMETATATGVTAEDKKPTIEEVKPTESGMCTVTIAPKDDVQKVTMTRGYALHHAHFTVQQAYDKFLKWCEDNPKEGSVMDFGTGVKSANAAFAYWLLENIVVEVPRTNARC